MGNYTVHLQDNLYGRIVLENVSASSRTAAEALAVSAPGVSGDNSGAGAYVAAGSVSQAVILAVSGTDASGVAIVSPTSLPVIPEVTASPSKL